MVMDFQPGSVPVREMIPFRYVGRKDDPKKITGQSGECSFAGQFDAHLYAEYFESLPVDAILDLSPPEQLHKKQQAMATAFEADYQALIAVVPVAVRRQIISLRLEINEHFRVGDTEAIEDAITGFKIPTDLPVELQEQMDAIQSNLLTILGE